MLAYVQVVFLVIKPVGQLWLLRHFWGRRVMGSRYGSQVGGHRGVRSPWTRENTSKQYFMILVHVCLTGFRWGATVGPALVDPCPVGAPGLVRRRRARPGHRRGTGPRAWGPQGAPSPKSCHTWAMTPIPCGTLTHLRAVGAVTAKVMTTGGAGVVVVTVVKNSAGRLYFGQQTLRN